MTTTYTLTDGYTIERIEGDVAHCRAADGHPIGLPAAWIPQSTGHVAWIGRCELYRSDSGDLYRAPISAPVMPDGYRCGRWEAPAWLADQAIELARQSAR